MKESLGSDSSESDTTSIDLFPRLHNEKKIKQSSSSNHSSNDDSSVDFLGNIEKSYPESNDSITFEKFESSDNSSQNDDIAFDSKIINQISQTPNEEKSGKFGYLKLYESLYKKRKEEDYIRDTDMSLQTIQSRSSSLFHLSKMDDFGKFVKQSALNDKIHAQVSNIAPRNEPQSALNVIDQQDLVENFYASNEKYKQTDESKIRNISESKLHWTKPKIKDPTIASKSDMSELYYPTTSSTENNILLQRKLGVRHLQMISLSGTLGVGLFLNSGKAITIAGGFGAVLAFVIVGVIVLFTMMSFCEMVTFVSVLDGVSGLSSRFVDDAFGFAAGWLYFISFSFGVAGEVVAGVIMLSYFPQLKTTTSIGSKVGWVTLFLGSIVVSNLIDIRIYGEVEYISSLIKLLWAFVMMITMIIVNRGAFNSDVLGFRYWTYSKSDFANNIIFGLFRPSFNLADTGTNPPSEGIQGDKGRFLSLLTALLIVSYAYSGTEIVCIAACEAKNPRKALPSATRRVFWRIVIFYCLSIFLVSLNVYAGDPRLLRYYSGESAISASDYKNNAAINLVGGQNCNYDSSVIAGYGNGAQSPWVVALQSTNLCNFSSAANAFLIFFAVSCGNAQLYVSSRTIYALALQGKAPKILTKCNRFGIPYTAVLFSGSLGLLSYTCVSESATVVFQNLNSVIASSGIFVWFAMCLTFVRFYFGLKRRPDIISRHDKSYPYKSPFQPYAAIIGMIGTAIIILSMGFVVFLDHEWNTMFFFSSYGPLMVFAVFYTGYRIIKGTNIPSLDKLDFDSGRTEMDRYIWDGGRDYDKSNVKDVISKWLSFLA